MNVTPIDFEAPPAPTSDVVPKAEVFEAARRVPLRDVALMLGRFVGGRITCPNCDAEKTSIEGAYLVCNCCSRRHSGLDLVRRVRKLRDDEGAARVIAATFGTAKSDEPTGDVLELLDGPAIAAPLPPLEHLVREIGLVAEAGAPHLVAGYGFGGKTLTMQALALSLAAGSPVWGTYRARKRRVLHVDLEQGERLSRRRYQRLALAMGVDLAELGDSLSLAAMPALSLSEEHAEAWRQLMIGRDLMIVDSLRAATAGADENDSAIRAGLDMLGALSEQTGCRVVVIHHARKPNADDPGGRYAIRGSSAIYDACDSVYVFSAAKGEPVLVEHVKARTHGEPCDNVALVIEDVERDGDPKAGLRVTVRGAELVTQRREEQEQAKRRARAASDARKLREVIGASPGLGVRDLRTRSALSGDRVAEALDALGAAVEVREVGEGRSRRNGHFLRLEVAS